MDFSPIVSAVLALFSRIASSLGGLLQTVWPALNQLADLAVKASLALFNYAVANPAWAAAMAFGLFFIYLCMRAVAYFSRPHLSVALPLDANSPIYLRGALANAVTAIASEDRGKAASNCRASIRTVNLAGPGPLLGPAVFLHWEGMKYLNAQEGAGISLSKGSASFMVAFENARAEQAGCWLASPVALTRVLDYNLNAPDKYFLPPGNHDCLLSVSCDGGVEGSLLVHITSPSKAQALALKKAPLSDELKFLLSRLFRKKAP